MLRNPAEENSQLLTAAREARASAAASKAVAGVLRSHSRRLQEGAVVQMASASVVVQRSYVVLHDRPRGTGLVLASPLVWRGTLQVALSRRLHSVLVAGDSVPGLGLAIAEQPDVILIDDRLPTITGLDTSYLLRAYAPGSRVVLFTNDERSVELAKLAGIVTSGLSVSAWQLSTTIDGVLAA